jgi:hypothetical protein
MLEPVVAQVSVAARPLLETVALLQVAQDKMVIQHIPMAVPKVQVEEQAQEHQFLALFSLVARRKVELVVVAQDFLEVLAVQVQHELVVAAPLTHHTLDLQ